MGPQKCTSCPGADSSQPVLVGSMSEMPLGILGRAGATLERTQGHADEWQSHGILPTLLRTYQVGCRRYRSALPACRLRRQSLCPIDPSKSAHSLKAIDLCLLFLHLCPLARFDQRARYCPARSLDIRWRSPRRLPDFQRRQPMCWLSYPMRKSPMHRAIGAGRHRRKC